MQTLEASKGRDSFIAALVIVAESADELSNQLAEAKAYLLDWHSKRGHRCKGVMFTIMTSQAAAPEIEGVLDGLRTDDVELAPLLQTLEIQVAFMGNGSKPFREYTVTPDGVKKRGAAPKSGCMVLLAAMLLGGSAVGAVVSLC